MTKAEETKTHFGQRTVTESEKTSLVGEVFSSVAGNYDRMNDAMSLGIHRLWKERLIREISPRPNLKYLDVAGGTGDIAFKIFRDTDHQAKITVCDINPDMLKVGQGRAIDRGILPNDGITWVEGNAETLPFEDSSFDVYTISFGLRNVTRMENALKDAYRVLRPGGRFYCLEFSRVVNPIFRKIYDAYSYKLIPELGERIANDRESYQYLVESIRQFPSQRKLANKMREAGFSKVKFTNLSGGIAAIHHGVRI